MHVQADLVTARLELGEGVAVMLERPTRRAPDLADAGIAADEPGEAGRGA
jgi:hypothetical protein